MNLNEFLAVEVMGWTQGETKYQWNDKHGNRMLDGILWKPTENIEQAMMCLDQFDEWEIFKEKNYYVEIDPFNNSVKKRMCSDFLPIAITRACAKAKGWKDE